MRRAHLHARQKIEGAPHAHRDADGEELFQMAIDPLILLRRAVRDKQQTRLRIIDALHDPLRIHCTRRSGEGAGDAQTRVTALQCYRRFFRHALTRAQQKYGAFFRKLRAEIAYRIHARHALGQMLPRQTRRPQQTGAVGDGQIRAVEQRAERRIAMRLHEHLAVGGYHVVLLLAIQIRMQTGDCLLSGKRIDPYAEDVHAGWRLHEARIAYIRMGRESCIGTMIGMIASRSSTFLCTLMLSACTIPAITDPSSLPAQPSSSTGATNTEESPVAAEPTAPDADSGSTVIDERLLPSGMLEVGAAGAPISIMLFTNTSCGYCRDFHEDLLPLVMNEYVRTGKARIAIVPFIVRKYEESEAAALTQLCAARQGKGMAMHDLLFRETVGSSAFRTSLTTMNIDQNALDQCMEDPASREIVHAHQAVAASLGITLIPSYTINGELHTGLPDAADLRGEIRN